MSTKSVSAEIAALEVTGRLTRFVARSRHPSRRRLFYGEKVKVALENPKSAISTLVGSGIVEAAFARWTLGDRIHGGVDGGHFLKRLKPPPPEIWEIRITEPIVQARVFGRFAEQDTFIATDIRTRGMLGKMGSKNWKSACAQCVSDWQALFPNHPPHSGATIHEFVSENRDVYPI
jgi:hypothetical protein